MTEMVAPHRRLERFLDCLIVLTILVLPTQLGFNPKEILTQAAEAAKLVEPAPQPGAITVTTPDGKTQTTVTAPSPSKPAEKTGLQRLLDRIPNAHFTIADILIWLALLVWILKVCVYAEFKSVRLWPLSVLALVVWGGLSLVQAWKPTGVTVNLGEGIKEAIQYVEYFIAGYLVFANAAGREDAFRRMALAFWAATTVVILIAILQYMNLPDHELPLLSVLWPPSADPMSVKGLFGDRNVLGAFLALAVPFMWGAVLCEKNWLVRLWLAAATCGGIFVTLSGGAMLAILLAMLAITAVRGQKVFVPVLVVLVLAGWFVWPHLPRKNTEVLVDSVLLYKPVKESEGWPWQQRYVEWQPALKAIAHSPFVGVGIGNYQAHINQFYGEISKPGGRNYMEPNAINGYAVLGVTAGVPALLILAWIVCDFRQRTAAAYPLLRDGLERSVALGVAGSLTGFAVVMLFTNVFVRGAGLTFILLLSLAAVVHTLATAPAPEKAEK